MSRNKITIVDVARTAGVSFKTVSRVINGEPHVSVTLAAKVRSAIEQLGYVPNAAARSLPGGRSFMIGALYDNPSPFYLANLQAGAMEACRERGYHLVIERLDAGDPKASIEHILRTARLDGVILSPPLTDHAALLEHLQERAIPLVRLSPLRNAELSASVYSDDEEGARQVARHFLAQGHCRFGYVDGPPTHLAAALRKRGFFAELETAGISPSGVAALGGDFSFASGMEAGMTLLAAGKVTAIFASNDDMAAGVMAAASRLGIRVPDHVSVAGFDDSPIATLLWPPLTTVRQPIAEMSAAAARMLIEQQADAGQSWRADVELVVRGSTAPSPA